MRFAFIEAEKANYSIDVLCRVMHVSRSGFYAWCHRESSQRQIARPTRRFVTTTQSEHDFQRFDNVVDRNFEPEAPNDIWAADITYIPTRRGWLYLAVILDLYSRRVVG